MRTMSVVLTGCLILISMGQMVLSQDESGGESGGDAEGGCPPLDPGSGSVKIVCEENKRPSSCKNPRVGTVARTVWKKDILKQGKGVAAAKCGADGSWKKMGGGGGGSKGKGYERMGEVGMIKTPLVAAPYDIALRMCEQDGGRVLVVDSTEKQAMVEEMKKTRNMKFLYAKFHEDIWAGISNKDNPQEFKTSSGESVPEGIPKYSERGEKTNAENSCVVYNMVKKLYWVIPCATNAGFLCEMI